MERGREDWKREAYKDQMVSHAGNDGVGYSSIMSAPEFVRIRVGGEIFETTKDTLTNDPGSIFSAMLSGEIPSARDSTGAILIDRDPRRFRVILNFMRNRSMVLDGLDPQGILDECDYYHLPAAAEATSRLMGPKQGSELLRCFVDPRPGRLMSLQAGERGILKSLEINLLRPTTVAVSAKLRVEQGINASVCIDGKTESSRMVRHEEICALGGGVEQWGKTLHVIAELDAGRHEIAVACEAQQRCGDDAHATTSISPGKGVAGGRMSCVGGPTRIEVWQYHDCAVEWERMTDFMTPEKMGRAEVESWTGGMGGEASELSEAFMAIASSVYE